ALLATDLLAVGVGRGIDPIDAPCAEDGIIGSDRRAVPIAGHRHDRRGRTAIFPSRDHPDVLNRTALKNPSKMDLALTLMADAVRRVRDDIRVPIADELAIQTKLFGAVKRWAVRMQRGNQARRLRVRHKRLPRAAR